MSVIIDNACEGLGDAVMYAWALWSANAGGERLRIYPRGRRDVFELLGAERWCDTDPAYPTVIGAHPPKGERDGRSWLRRWLDDWGFDATPIANPVHTLTPEELAWGHEQWTARAGNGKRVLIVPDGIYNCRTWAKNRFERVAWMLRDRGCAVIAALSSYRDHRFPFAYGGLPLRQFAALIATANVLIGNESGPVHLAAALGTPAFCIYGPTIPGMMHGHTSLVTELRTSADRVPCLGCNFEYARGFRSFCDDGCSAMHDVTAWHVASAVFDSLGIVSEGRPSPRPEYEAADATIIGDVFDQDCYQVNTMPEGIRRVVDVGAHIGTFAAKVLTRYTGAQVVLVECEPSNVLECVRTCAEDPRRIVKAAALHYGAPSVRVMSTVFAGTSNTGGSSIDTGSKTWSEEYREGATVATTTLEEIQEEMGWDRIDLLKLDCEGSEFNILEHCDLSRIGMIVGEWHDLDRFCELLWRRFAGWRLEVLREGQLGVFRLTPPARGGA